MLTEEQYTNMVKKALEAEKARPKTGHKYELRLFEGDKEEIYLQGSDVEVDEMMRWSNGYKVYGNTGVLSGFYYGSGTRADYIGTVMEIEYGRYTTRIVYEGKEIEVEDRSRNEIHKRNKTLRLYRNDEMIDEVVLDGDTEYVDGAMDKEVRLEGHILKCITLRELYRFPTYVNPENPHHRKIPYEISSVSFSL